MQTAVTEQVAAMILEDRRSSIVDSAFIPCPQSLLEAPVPPAPRARAGAAKTPKRDGLRRSARQKAQTVSVPVSKRATHRLIKAFELVGPSEPIGEQAMQAFISSFDAPMTEKRIKAVRTLTSLDSDLVLAASEQLAEHDMAGAEEVAV